MCNVENGFVDVDCLVKSRETGQVISAQQTNMGAGTTAIPSLALTTPTFSTSSPSTAGKSSQMLAGDGFCVKPSRPSPQWFGSASPPLCPWAWCTMAYGLEVRTGPFSAASAVVLVTTTGAGAAAARRPRSPRGPPGANCRTQRRWRGCYRDNSCRRRGTRR